jgi:quercetin dioxygenase-like cupin family protein
MKSDGQATKYLDLAAEMTIPDNGTLSRVLHSDEHVRLVVFAFDTGQELTDHAAGVPAIVQVVSGRLALTLEEETVEIDSRSWIHMPARLPHAVRALEPSIMVLSLLKGSR